MEHSARGAGSWVAIAASACLAAGMSHAAGAADADVGGGAGVAGAAGTAVLDRFLTGLRTLNTDFTQTVTDGHGTQTEAGSGRLAVQRPDKFRWDYRPSQGSGGSGNSGASGGPSGSGSGSEQESGQLMVADGKNLWFYDRELEQVTVKPIGGALSSTPIMLLSSTPARLQQSFRITSGGTHEGLQWVEVKPRSADADFGSAALGFEREQLARMMVHDNLGQTVRLDFSHGERNVPIAAALFQFKPPSGVDVIGTAH